MSIGSLSNHELIDLIGDERPDRSKSLELDSGMIKYSFKL
jgi:hypothetical protein